MEAEIRSQVVFSHWVVIACQAPPSMGLSRQEYRSGLPFPSPEDLSHPGFELGSPTLQADSLPSEPPGEFSNFQKPRGPHNCQKTTRNEGRAWSRFCSQPSRGTNPIVPWSWPLAPGWENRFCCEATYSAVQLPWGMNTPSIHSVQLLLLSYGHDDKNLFNVCLSH